MMGLEEVRTVPNAVVYLTALTLYIIAIVGYSFRYFEDEDVVVKEGGRSIRGIGSGIGSGGHSGNDRHVNDGSSGDPWNILWGSQSHPIPSNTIGILPPGAVIPRTTTTTTTITTATTTESSKSTARRLLDRVQRVYNNNNNHSKKSNTIPVLSWEIDSEVMNKIEKKILLCFVNSKSGGQDGHHVLTTLLSLLPSHQVFDIGHINPITVLMTYKDIPSLRILVSGGDGTVNWILEAMDSIEWTSKRRPALAIYPIGTGNDLANHLGWLTYFEEHVLCSKVLQDVLYSPSVLMDRWKMTIETPYSLSSSSSIKPRVFINYLGIGVDAAIVRKFHQLRQSRPEVFVHALVNKLVYGLFGWQQAAWGGDDLIDLFDRKDIRLWCDGKEVLLPKDIEGLVLVNINSYAGGSTLWTLPTTTSTTSSRMTEDDFDSNTYETSKEEGEREQEQHCFLQQSAGDGMIEVVAVESSLELARIKLGLSECRKVCQGYQLEIHIKVSKATLSLPLQMDGEPFLLQDLLNADVQPKKTLKPSSKGEGGEWLKLKIERTAQQVTMVQAPSTQTVYYSDDHVGNSPTNHTSSNLRELLKSAVEKGIITSNQQKKLLAENELLQWKIM